MNAVVQFQPPRLPFHPAIEERFGVDKGAWKALVEAVYPAAQSVDSVCMALAYCKQRNLDPFKRPVHIVPVWDSKRHAMIETVWPGICELRTTAMRTGQYAGCDETAFGPDITTKLGGVEVTFPEWAQITVYRLVGGMRCPIVGPKTYWMETYATAKRDTEAPNSMWRKRPRGQLEKCAEAGGLRKAFPEELGNEYAAEEMHGQALGGDGGPLNTVEKAAPRKLHAEFEADEAEVVTFDAATGEVIDAEVDLNVDPPAEEMPAAHVETEVEAEPTPSLEALGLKTGAEVLAEKGTAAADDAFDPLDWAASFNRGLDELHTVPEVAEAWGTAKRSGLVGKLKAKSPALAKNLADAVNARCAAIEGG